VGGLIGQRGYTLIELMAAITIAAILMAIAIPGFRVIAQNTQQRNAISDLNAVLSKMRTESAVRHRGISFCASADQLTCSGAATWESGWILFVDGSSGAAANGVLDAGEQVVQVHEKLPSGITLRTVGPSSVITLNADGLLIDPTTSATARVTFRYCDERGLTSLRAIIMGTAGVVRIATDGKDHSGATITSCI